MSTRKVDRGKAVGRRYQFLGKVSLRKKGPTLAKSGAVSAFYCVSSSGGHGDGLGVSIYLGRCR